MTLKATLIDFYKFNFYVSLKQIPRIQGWKRLVRGIEYFRCIEYPLIFNSLKLESGASLLDIGSANSVFPLFACSRGMKVWAVDIDDRVFKLRQDAKGLPLAGTLTVEMQDARNLQYPDDSFRFVSAISTLEHIPENGDIKAIREIARVLELGGRAGITVPFGSSQEERQRYVRYFQRVYDREALWRLIKSSQLHLISLMFFGETEHEFTKYYWNLPLVSRIPLMWLEAVFSKLFLTTLGQESYEVLPNGQKMTFLRTAGAILVLQK